MPRSVGRICTPTSSGLSAGRSRSGASVQREKLRTPRTACGSSLAKATIAITEYRPMRPRTDAFTAHRARYAGASSGGANAKGDQSAAGPAR